MRTIMCGIGMCLVAAMGLGCGTGGSSGTSSDDGVTEVFTGDALPDATTPCGAQEVIETAATAAGKTAEEFYNTVLFDSSVLDNFCLNKPAGATTTGQQQFYYNTFCSSQQGSYFSYANFIVAAAKFPTFACDPNATATVRYKELANFLATIAQETTKGTGTYTKDGLYVRYEFGALLGSTMSDRTQYFPADTYHVAVKLPDASQVYTDQFWEYSDASSATIYDLTQSQETISFGAYTDPVGFQAKQLNQAVDPGYWVGMGPTQLTGYVMMGFFGWYQNNITQVIANANLQDFIQNYLKDGTLGFTGALWYWMVHVSGYGYRTIHNVVNDSTRPLCQDIGAATLMVNGGCNNFSPGRKDYYTYFAQTALGLTITPVTQTVSVSGQSYTLSSMDCVEPSPEVFPLLAYCRPQ